MDAAERACIESLLQTHRSHLQVLEQQAATFGVMAPPYVVTQMAEYQQKIAELEARLHPRSLQSTTGPRHNLPPRDYEHFVGRQPELAELRRLLGPKSRSFVITIDGIGGIGKSALALETAYSFLDQYTDLLADERFEAIVWVSAKRSYLTASGIHERRQVFRTLEDVFAAIARVLDYPAITRAPTEEQREIVEQVVREQRTLLILDNLETVDDESLQDFLHELPEPTKALITTRHRIDVARPVRLTGMQHADALALIVQEAARKDVILTADEQEELWQRTGGVPLAIVWSIGLMGLGASVESVLRRLGSGQSDIARFCFEESITRIRGTNAYYLLLALSVFAADASREAIGVVAGLGKDESGRDMGLEELLKLSLVNKEGERFSLLPLTRSYVQNESATQSDWIRAAHERLQSYFYELTKAFGGWSKDWQGQDRVEYELANIFPVINSLVNSLRYQQIHEGDQIIDPESIPQAKMIDGFIRRVARTCRIRGYWGGWERICHIGINIGRMINEADHVGWYCMDLCRISYYRNDLDNASRWALEARTEFQRGDSGLEVWANRLLGIVSLHNGQIEQATEIITTAMNRYKQMGGRSGLYSFLGSMGELAEYQDDVSAAISWYQQKIDLLKQENNIYSLSSGTLNLGRAMFASGDTAGAQACYEESLKLARECGRMDIIAKVLYRIAQLEEHLGQSRSAEFKARQALDLFRRLGLKREQAEAEALLTKLAEQS
jgi:tetratricopeptide (TPR) repeat protein